MADLVLRLRRSTRPPTVWRPLDAFLYNLMTTNVMLFFGLPVIAVVAFYYPVGGLTAAILITAGFCLAEGVVYALLVSTLPRNGGDYLFQTRLMSRFAGSVFSFTGVVIGGAMWMGIAGWFASKLVVGPPLILLGNDLHSQPLVAAGQWLLTTKGVVLLGLLATAWSTLVNLWGMRVYARIQRVVVLAGLVALGILTLYFALTALSINQSAYRSIYYRSLEVGFSHQGHVTFWQATLALIPVVAFGLIYPGWVTFQAGEIGKAENVRVQLATIVGGKAVGLAFALVLLPLPIRHLGEELYASSVYLALHDPRSFWMLAPRLFGFAGVRWLSVLIIVSLAVAANTWFWMWVPNHTLAASRVLLSMSWDRLLPRWMSDLHPRTGVPAKAILAFGALCCATVLLYADLGVWRLALHGTLVSLIMFAATCVAGGLFPFTRRELYRESTAGPFELLRVPLITVAGLVFAGFAAFLAWRYVVTDPFSTGDSPGSHPLVISLLYLPSVLLVLFFGRLHQGAEGREIEIVYSEAESAPHPVQATKGSPVRVR